MSTKMLLTAKLDQRLVMSQQLTQAITLLQYNTLDLKQLVQQYIETNPLIDVEEVEAENTAALDDDQYAQYTTDSAKASYVYKDDNALENYSSPESLREHLIEQTLLCKFDKIEQLIAEAIIDAIDENGYLTMSLPEIQQSLANLGPPSINSIESILKVIQTFDPLGVGGSHARECLLIQLYALPEKTHSWEISRAILEEHFEMLSYNNTKLIRQLNTTQEQFTQALMLIRSLNPKPGLAFLNETNICIEPELYVKKVRSSWRVFLTESILTNIKINQQYQDLIREHKKHDSYEALHKELQEAQWLLKGLKRRNETLLNVATHIVKMQKDFIEHGQSFMKPMNIIDVAQELNLHESTVSRVTTGKFIATPRGVFELKYFFPSYVLTDSGDSCSDTAVKEFIKEIIAQENAKHVYSDSEIAGLLKQKGINIARRTIAKYRDAMKILPSYQRAQLQQRHS